MLTNGYFLVEYLYMRKVFLSLYQIAAFSLPLCLFYRLYIHTFYIYGHKIIQHMFKSHLKWFN